ncbi:uncharacterized protein LOC132732376 [Ruditapes philippinarum]|uniref:uncharacterized protein LOC132732376 n=1 Tax=Ruditapes philippinarum TaxID=129788 RepID=UPI00295AFAA9|nr:uncharacterized protein LOC132732376 [Ruditapes philippinarum]
MKEHFLWLFQGIGATKFWGAKTLSVEHCMKLCVRQSQCKSINFDLKTRMCELNNNLRHGTQKASDSNVYSEFQSWPPEVDEMCYSRPCKDNEVCIPKSLLMSSDDGKCSYSCMQFSRPVCPLPKMGTFNGRTVGSVNIVKCPKGMKGGGSAECQQNLKWDKKINKCVGFRFRNENETKKFVRADLETNHDGEWKQVSSDNWNWNKTQVACRDLLDLE